MSSRTVEKHTAAGQALGYSLQYTRMTAKLLEAGEGSFLSLEVLDDVAETNQDRALLVQSKSALTDNPVSDRAVPLWKTLAIWSASIAAGQVNLAKTEFELYVSRKAEGEIVNALSSAVTDNDARVALAAAKKSLLGSSTHHPLSETLRPHVERFFELPEDQAVSFVKQFRLVCGSGSPQSDIEAILRTHPVSASRIPLIADHICGWVKRTVDKLLEQSAPAIVSRDEFHTAYTSFCRKVDRDMLLPSVGPKPSPSAAAALIPEARVFIRQLELIKLPYEDQLAAASDFLRASSDRTAWAAWGDVDEESFVELEEGLKRTWTNERLRCSIEHGSRAEVERGQLLFLACMSHRAPVQAMEAPNHFIPGCFHGLADDKSVGWHPSYDALLSGGT